MPLAPPFPELMGMHSAAIAWLRFAFRCHREATDRVLAATLDVVRLGVQEEGEEFVQSCAHLQRALTRFEALAEEVKVATALAIATLGRPEGAYRFDRYQ